MTIIVKIACKRASDALKNTITKVFKLFIATVYTISKFALKFWCNHESMISVTICTNQVIKMYSTSS